MAVDKNKTTQLLDEIDTLFDSITGGLKLPVTTTTRIKEVLLGPAITEVKEFVRQSRRKESSRRSG
jgi:hypothetical protein